MLGLSTRTTSSSSRRIIHQQFRRPPPPPPTSASASSLTLTGTSHSFSSSSSSAAQLGDESIKRLTSTFESKFRPAPCDYKRQVGREAEYPVVWKDGSAADVRLLLRELLNKDKTGTFRPVYEDRFSRLLCAEKEGRQLVGVEGGGMEFSAEVGTGTVEVINGPFPSLHELSQHHEAAMVVLIAAADSLGMRIVGMGTQPRTGATEGLMLPRLRYLRLLQALGEPWLWFTITSSDQLHVDISRAEMIDVLNMANFFTPLVIGLCGNSPMVDGSLSPYMSSREGLMGRIHSNLGRHGMAHSPHQSVHSLINWLADLPLLLPPTTTLVTSNVNTPVSMKDIPVKIDQENNNNANNEYTNNTTGTTGGYEKGKEEISASSASPPRTHCLSFRDHVKIWEKEEGKVDTTEPFVEETHHHQWKAFMGHEHYVWNAGRLRSAHSTIEMRAACQQPFSEHMNAAALYLAMVEGWKELNELVKSHFGVGVGAYTTQEEKTLSAAAWRNMRVWNEHVIRFGLAGLKDGRTDEIASQLAAELCRASERGDTFGVYRAVHRITGCYFHKQRTHSAEGGDDEQELEFKRVLLESSTSLIQANKLMLKIADNYAKQTQLGPVKDLEGFFKSSLTICEKALEKRGKQEAQYLSPLRNRLTQRMNPGQEAAEIGEKEGMAALLEARTAQIPHKK